MTSPREQLRAELRELCRLPPDPENVRALFAILSGARMRELREQHRQREGAEQ